MKRAILVVSFGTSYSDTLDRTIAATERAIAAAYPGWELRRAFTSGIIMRKLLKRDGLKIDSVEEALCRLEAEGFTHVAVQSTHVMHGEEYEKMLAQLEPHRLHMRIRVGMPLLHGEADYAEVADALLAWLPPLEADEGLVFMGHGTTHFANAAYAQMEHMLRARCDRVYMATVEGYPALDSAIARLAKRPEIRRLMLAPFMLVAGDHAHNDMTGDEDSWENTLRARGYQVRSVLRGLGECERIRALFVEHCRQAVDALTPTGKLWGVGVGPGDPELMTLKAARVLREADVIAAPDASGSERTSLNIAKDHIRGKELLFIKTPMVRDRAALDAAYDAAAARIGELLDRGKQVAFLTLGDPTIYSTYMNIHDRVLRQGYAAEVVPGVPSFCAAAARLNLSLCQGSEPLLIVPASHGADALMDLPANKVYMKAGHAILELQQALAAHGQLEGASLVENCGMADERVYPAFADLTEPSGYFSLVISKGGKV